MTRAAAPEPFHPDLAAARWIPLFSAGPRSLWLWRLAPPGIRSTPDVHIETREFPGATGPLPYRVLRPVGAEGALPALLWIHGGGLVLGTPQQDDAANLQLVRELGITVFAASYRLAPEHPAPAALDDLVAGFRDLVARADELGIDPSRIAIGGASAGGGLAAALALRLRDEGGVQPVFQLLVYPMLDDRTGDDPSIDRRHLRLWSPESNRWAWTSYLGADAAALADRIVPARRADLAGLPPAWIGVGTLDLFHDEDVAYAEKLRAAGVNVELHIVPGAFHGFDAAFGKADVSKDFRRRWAEALAPALTGT